MFGENKMKKALAIILSICFVFCLTACNKDNATSDVMSENSQITSTENQTSDLTDSNESTESSKPTESNNSVVVSNMTEEQVRKIVQEEIAKIEKSDINVDEITQKVLHSINAQEQFKIGEKLYNPLGDNFKLPINGQTNRFVTITKLEVTNKKEADASNLDDYWKSGNYRYFARYIYEVKIVGKVDAKFVGKEIYINLQFESSNEFFAAGGAGKATIKNDGTFEFNYLAHSNKHEKVIIPHSAYISEF